MYISLRLLQFLSALLFGQSDWFVTLNTFDENPLKSLSFWSKSYDYSCPSRQCKEGALPANTKVHMMIGTEHTSGFPMLVLRMCEIFQYCINKQVNLISLCQETPVVLAVEAVIAPNNPNSNIFTIYFLICTYSY